MAGVASDMPEGENKTEERPVPAQALKKHREAEAKCSILIDFLKFHHISGIFKLPLYSSPNLLSGVMITVCKA